MRNALVGCILVAASLGACNSPSIPFMSSQKQTVTVEGSTFDVRRRDNKVEVIRTNMEAVFAMRAIMPRAAAAVVLATGCTPRDGTWSGDPAVMHVTVDCP